ncbi:MAG: 2-hydroxychromene-2-carboxylate isomerase [Gammaproteobacteria bacterium]|nr:2-hydroxychromene-2-carboxylate isomerase [Gammaproteobacteria bacterium]
MAQPIDFYFDFTSPYGYLASTRIEEVASRHGRSVNWHPIVLGFVFKVTGSVPLVSIPLKGEYATMDIERSARQHNIPYRLPDNFPVGTVAAARTCLWLKSADFGNDPETMASMVHALYRAYFVDNIDISDTANVIAVAAAQGIDTDTLSSALENTEVKGLLKTAVDAAVEKGIFGSPFILVDGEPFWGHDRLKDVEQWLETGGF